MVSKPPKSSASVPNDPDPTPIARSEADADVQAASREERKRAAAAYGRRQTILAGNTAQNNAAKKTVLGG